MHALALVDAGDADVDTDRAPHAARLAVGETVILLRPHLPVVGFSIWMERGRHQNESLADGHARRNQRGGAAVCMQTNARGGGGGAVRHAARRQRERERERRPKRWCALCQPVKRFEADVLPHA